VHVLERNRVIITGRNNGDYRCRCTMCNNKTSFYCTKCSTPEHTVFVCKYGSECYKAHNSGAEVARSAKKNATDYVVYGANTLTLGENDQVVRGPVS